MGALHCWRLAVAGTGGCCVASSVRTTPTTARHQDGDPFRIEIDQRIDKRYDLNDTDTITL